ncbi:HNH endonuclease [Paenimyroides tangerinum]|nr:HNH endonuclease [Paenimyroides tangerinum]
MARPTKKLDIIHSKKYRNQVEEDIKNNNLSNKVEDFREEFIKFCCLERLNYEADINDELDQFFKRKRMYSTNVKEWKRITNYILKRDNYTCAYCKKVGGVLEIDHVVPFSKGGSDEYENLVTACLKCNRQKKDKSVSEFINNRKK